MCACEREGAEGNRVVWKAISAEPRLPAWTHNLTSSLSQTPSLRNLSPWQIETATENHNQSKYSFDNCQLPVFKLAS